MDPRNQDINLDDLVYSRITQLTEDDMKRQEADYIYRYRYNGGGASQVWLSSDRYCLINGKQLYFFHPLILYKDKNDIYARPQL